MVLNLQSYFSISCLFFLAQRRTYLSRAPRVKLVVYFSEVIAKVIAFESTYELNKIFENILTIFIAAVLHS